MIELLPCPFCGGEAKVATGQGQHDGHGYIVFCDRCWVHQSYLDMTEAEAIAAWNTRAERTCENPCSVGFECSKCGVTCGGYPLKDATRFSWNYCPNCGAKVVS